jgi:hypothetical protein
LGLCRNNLDIRARRFGVEESPSSGGLSALTGFEPVVDMDVGEADADGVDGDNGDNDECAEGVVF